jgi:hypothetical protein
MASKRNRPRAGLPHNVRSVPGSTACPHFSGTRWAPREMWLPARYAAGSTSREIRSDATFQSPTVLTTDCRHAPQRGSHT